LQVSHRSATCSMTFFNNRQDTSQFRHFRNPIRGGY